MRIVTHFFFVMWNCHLWSLHTGSSQAGQGEWGATGAEWGHLHPPHQPQHAEYTEPPPAPPPQQGGSQVGCCWAAQGPQ